MSEQSYIIRIYRCAENESGMSLLDGIVEMPESGKREAFHDSQGLWAILAGKAKPGRVKKARRGRKHQRSRDPGDM